MTDPLAGLDDVSWAELRHAYGPANDTPGLLRRLGAGNVDDDTWEALCSSLAHQGTVYRASARAAPFLVALTRTLAGADLEGVLTLLEPIAAGAADDEAIARACVAAAEAGFARYLELLADPSPGVRGLAASLVARFPRLAHAGRARYEAALDAERDASARIAIVRHYLAFAPLAEPDVEQRLRGLVGATPALAALAAFGLLKARDAEPEPAWVDAIARENAEPEGMLPSLPARDVVRDAPPRARATLFDAFVAASPRAERRAGAFDLGQAILFLAFGDRLGAPAKKPVPFVFVESPAFPMPWPTGGGAPATLERAPAAIHWRAVVDRPPRAEWTCSPFVKRWDFPRPGYWTEPPRSGESTAVAVAAPTAAESLGPRGRRAIEALARWDAFWRTDSDLPMVYGLPTSRDRMAALVGV